MDEKWTKNEEPKMKDNHQLIVTLELVRSYKL